MNFARESESLERAESGLKSQTLKADSAIVDLKEALIVTSLGHKVPLAKSAVLRLCGYVVAFIDDLSPKTGLIRARASL